MKKYNTVSMQYIPGEYYITQGHKGHERNHYNKSGRYVNQRGFGWASEYKSSELILYLERDGKSLAVRIDPYFKEIVGRMTQKRIDKIIAAMPDEVHVEKHTSDYGNSYFAVSENDLNEWRKASGLKKK